MTKIPALSFLQNNSTFTILFISRESAILGQKGNRKHWTDLAKANLAHVSNVSRLQEM